MEGGVMVEVCAKEVQVSWEKGSLREKEEQGEKFFSYKQPP